MNCNHWLGRLANLNAARTAVRGIAPHKPLMLLTVIDLIESGNIPCIPAPYMASLDFIKERGQQRTGSSQTLGLQSCEIFGGGKRRLFQAQACLAQDADHLYPVVFNESGEQLIRGCGSQTVPGKHGFSIPG